MIAAEHGGRIGVFTFEKNHILGTSFYVEVPVSSFCRDLPIELPDVFPVEIPYVAATSNRSLYVPKISIVSPVPSVTMESVRSSVPSSAGILSRRYPKKSSASSSSIDGPIATMHVAESALGQMAGRQSTMRSSILSVFTSQPDDFACQHQPSVTSSQASRSRLPINSVYSATMSSMSTPTYGNMSALVVDDAASNRKMLLRHLASRFSTCDEAEDGATAVAKLSGKMGENKSYDIILLDFVMPAMDGPAAAKEMRNLGYSGHIVGVTGNALSDDISLFIQSGANVVMTKPLDVKAFDQYLAGEQIIMKQIIISMFLFFSFSNISKDNFVPAKQPRRSRWIYNQDGQPPFKNNNGTNSSRSGRR